VIPLHEDIN
jgi:hypothetical protein